MANCGVMCAKKQHYASAYFWFTSAKVRGKDEEAANTAKHIMESLQVG
jgi:hypothetical protein